MPVMFTCLEIHAALPIQRDVGDRNFSDTTCSRLILFCAEGRQTNTLEVKYA